MLDWVHPHKHQHGTILYMSDYTVSLYSQPAQAYDMNSTHVRLMKVLLWQLFFRKLEMQRDTVPPNSASNAFASLAVSNGALQAAPHWPVQ